MRTVLFADGSLGLRTAEHLLDRGDLIGLVVHPSERRRFPVERLSDQVPLAEWPVSARQVARLRPARLLSVMFGFKIPPDILRLTPDYALNLHPGLLPWNKGADPNVWPLVDGSPAGTTLHRMTDVIDEGEVIAQRPVAVLPEDTAEDLYERLLDASFELLVETWPKVDDIVPRPQPEGGSTHRRRDLVALDLTPEDFRTLDKLRARTFRDFGAEFERDGRRYRAQVVIRPMDE